MKHSLDFSDPATQASFSPAGIRAFANIMKAWSIEDQDAALLLGDVPHETYCALKENSDEAHLGKESLTRISLAIGIYRALHTLFSKQLANQWVKLPNRGSIFQGLTPLAYMLSHGVEGMYVVRRKLDSDCQAPYL
jgi:hypothetical protein